MAGIGFELRRTLEGRTFASYVRAYLAALAYASGPWICTIVSLSSIVVLSRAALPTEVVEQFTVTTVYVYAMSLLLAGPLQLITTRFVSDRLYEGRREAIPAGVATALGLAGLLALAVGSAAASATTLPPGLRISAVFLFCLVTCLWMVMSYVTCLKNYRLVTLSFALGMALATVLAMALALATPYPLLGLMWGYATGHLCIFLVLVTASLREMPGEVAVSREYLSYLGRYPSLLLAGLLANLAIWIDKFIIWWHHGTQVFGLFLFHPPYDIPAYLAYLTAMPSTAFFLIQAETAFAETYDRYVRSLLAAPAEVVTQRKRAMIDCMRDGLSQLASFQGVISLVAVLAAPLILRRVGLGDCPPLLYRTLIVAAFFHFMFLHVAIYVMYLDRRAHLVALQALFVVASGGFTWLALQTGRPALFGLGYAVAAFLATAVATVVLLVKAEESDADILFMQPLLDARGRVIVFQPVADGEWGGRVLYSRREPVADA